MRARAQADRHSAAGDPSGLLPVLRPPRLVGREDELRSFTDALAQPPAVVLVEGEAGIGKSRLVREALAGHCGTGRPLIAVCPPFREALTLGPLVDAVRDACPDGVAGLALTPLAGALRPLLPEWADDLPAAPEPAADAGAARHRLLRALAELLDRLGVSPLVIEDVHWADDATLDFLLFLTSSPTRDLGLVLTYRPEDVPSDSLLPRLTSRPSAGVRQTRITLGPLDVSRTAELVSSMLDDERVSEAFSAFLRERTDGIPLALEESVRLLRDRADLVRRDDEWVRHALADIAVPPTIRDAVSERAARLGPDAGRLLQAAAVIGEPAEESVLFSVSGLPEERARSAVEAAIRSGLLTDDDFGRVAFRHVLAVRAVYDGLTATDRRRLHRRAGDALETVGQPSASRLARHFREAGDTGRWGRYGEQAADLALAAGDHATAVAFLKDLLARPGLPAPAVTRLVQKIPLLAIGGFPDRAALIRTLRAFLGSGALSPRDSAEVRAQLGRLLIDAGEYGAGTAELERALPGLSDEPLVVARAMTVLGVPTGSPVPAAHHRRWLDRAAELVEREVPPAARLPFLVDHSNALLSLGQSDGWAGLAALPEDSADADHVLHLDRSKLNAGDAAMHWGRYEQAGRWLDDALDRAERHHFQGLHDLIRATRVHLDWFTGRWDGLAGRAAALADVGSEPRVRLEGMLLTGLRSRADGDLRAAEENLDEVFQEGLRRDVIEMQLEPAAALAGIALARGDTDQALALTDNAVRVVVGKEIWLWGTEVLPVRVQGLLAAGRSEEAERIAEGFARGLLDCDAAAPAAALAVCRALLTEGPGRHREAAEAWESAAAAWRALPRPYDALLASERAALCRLTANGSTEGSADSSANGSPESSADCLDQLSSLHGQLVTLGARGDAERIAGTLREHGREPRPVWRGGRRGYGDRLSPRETEVVRLLLNGLTNREIAAVLCRSPKTVATQLNSAMRKHGVTSRTALALGAARAGVTPADPDIS
ncbi:AAA family ATPase [Streptomyces sp. NBC_01267]|uniref:helix-turn-helix transcriptional regulator n=1 Tax=Streptomyces sp. NBC_01267 TaxID=2903805 RepID=UPI002E31A5ED|nr:AAA family ATPase [Streptomyces sp. NBC_01267]